MSNEEVEEDDDDDTRLPLWLFGSVATFHVLMFFGVAISSLYEKKDTCPEPEKFEEKNPTLEAIDYYLTDYTGLPDSLKKDLDLKFTHMVGGERDGKWVYDLTLKKASPATNPEIGYNEAIGIILAHAKEHLESENPAPEAQFSVAFLAGKKQIPANIQS